MTTKLDYILLISLRQPFPYLIHISLPCCLTLCIQECANNVLYSLFSVKRERGWRTFKRPGVDAFLEHMAKFYEIVVYSDQQPMVS